MIINDTSYLTFKELSVTGRYVTNNQIIKVLQNLKSDFSIETVGFSVQDRPIKSIEIGSGKSKILMWSQMHGNESTTTKAVLDLMNFLGADDLKALNILESCTIKIIPILSPDGAEVYTRINANNIDLNRDAQNLSQPESKILRKVYDEFKPDFCFNLHDQRTIFNVGNTSRPATVSFLAPSHDVERSISKSRAISMQLIAAMNSELQERIPGQVGRYDDGFNANCVGDTFQMLHTPTILFEAGHFHEDYEREKTRSYIFHALVTALTCVAGDKIKTYAQSSYFEIPENKKLFYDILIKNADVINDINDIDIGILYVEVLKNGRVVFEPKIENKGNLEKYYGHKTYDCKQLEDLESLKKQNFWKLL